VPHFCCSRIYVTFLGWWSSCITGHNLTFGYPCLKIFETSGPERIVYSIWIWRNAVIVKVGQYLELSPADIMLSILFLWAELWDSEGSHGDTSGAGLW
jgi:hypothetical protein